MEVQIVFTFDASELGGQQLVTFEELYDLSNPDEPKKVTEHKDIKDEGQTVTIKEVPEVPEEPEKPETPTTPDTPTRTDSPKTGDSTNLMAFIVMLIASAGGLAGTYFYKLRRKKKSKDGNCMRIEKSRSPPLPCRQTSSYSGLSAYDLQEHG